MSSFPGSPLLQKGAIVGIDPFNPLTSVIVFQYNPHTMTRTLRAQTAGGETGGQTARGEALRLKGPPQESIKLDVEIDAVDQLEGAQFPATTMGVHPALAALEMLIYPKSAVVIANEVLANMGVIEVMPPEAPLTLFVWGAQRTLPVRITDLTITEEAFDPNLNPIRAKVDLSMQVLSYYDLGLQTIGGGLYMVHQIAKEIMAVIGSGSGTYAGLES
jgi:hypothetical protein